MLTLNVIRALPGAGKTTLAKRIASDDGHLNWPDIVAISADDFMVDENGEYCFNPSKLAEVHMKCQEMTRQHLTAGVSAVVHNTFCENWEVTPYREIARDCRAQLVIISLFDGGLDDIQLAKRNVHHVPRETISSMRARFDHALIGDPRAPWARK